MNLAGLLPTLFKKALPAGVLLNAIGNSNPKVKGFISSALAGGFTADQVAQYIMGKLQGPQSADRGRFEQRSAQGVARPEEQLALKEQQQAEMPGKVLSAATGLGGALVAGLQSLAPGQQGAPQQQQASVQTQQVPQQVQQAPSVAQQEADKWNELQKFISKLVSAGNSIEKAVSSAKRRVKFKSLIDEYDRDRPGAFLETVKQLFSQQQQSQKSTETHGQLPAVTKYLAQQQSPMAAQASQQPAQGGMSASDQALMQAIQALQAKLG